MQTFRSPLRFIPSGVFLCTPPISCNRMPFLTISWPARRSAGQRCSPLQAELVLTIYRWCDTRHEPGVDVLVMDHQLELVNLLRGERLQEFFARVF